MTRICHFCIAKAWGTDKASAGPGGLPNGGHDHDKGASGDTFATSDFIDPSRKRPALARWALNDWPYVLLLLAMGGIS